GLVLDGTQGIEFVGLGEDVPAGPIFVALDDGSVIDGSVHGAVLGVAQTLSAAGVEKMRRGHVAGADGGIGLQGNANQAELQQSRPTGSAIRRGAGKGQRIGSVRRQGIVHGEVSEEFHSYGRGLPPRWRSSTAEPLGRDRRDTSRQFQRKTPGFSKVLPRPDSTAIAPRWPCDP